MLKLAALLASIVDSILKRAERKELKKAGSDEEKVKNLTAARNELKKTRGALERVHTDKSIADKLRARYGINK